MIDGGTIAALSTPSGRGGIAVIRISGGNTETILRKIIENFPLQPKDRKAVHTYVIDKGKRIEECVWTIFKAPNSYTGEDVAEISVHSNPFLVEFVLDLIYTSGAREALPGEFTYRAFRNGKIDLIQAEAVNELINANSKYFAEMKFGNLEGNLSGFLEKLKENLIGLAVKVEGIIEFQEDHSLNKINFTPELDSALHRIQNIVSGYRFNDILDVGLKIVIVGKANTGKSSLFNALLMEERSIISSTPGTTRDFIRERIFVNGFPIELIDVAGINSGTEDDVEKLGIEKSIGLVEGADAVIFMLDSSRKIDENDKKIFSLLGNKTNLIVANKSDISKEGFTGEILKELGQRDVLNISVLENSGIEGIYDFIRTVTSEMEKDKSEIAVNFRQKKLLSEILDSLKRAKNVFLKKTGNIEIVAEEIRIAVGSIGKLLGEITDEDILGEIFSTFCVGK